MAKRGMAMGATTKANIGAGRKSGLRLSSGGLGTSPFSQAKSAASKSVRKVNSEVKSKIAKAKKKGIAGKPTSKKDKINNLPSSSSSSDIGIDSFRASKAKAILEGTMRAKKRMERRIGFSVFTGLVEFNKKEENKKAKGYLQIGTGTVLAQQGIRSGVPRALGVRLEQHGTSRKAAKNIIKEGYLDPGRGGSEGGVTKALKLPKDFLDRARGHTFISGKNKTHPLYKERTQLSPIGDVVARKVQVLGYRGSKSGPITEKDVQRGTKYIGLTAEATIKRILEQAKKTGDVGLTREQEEELLERLKKLKVPYNDPERIKEIRERQKRVRAGLKEFLGTEEYQDNLRYIYSAKKGVNLENFDNLTDADFVKRRNPKGTLQAIAETNSPLSKKAAKLAKEIETLEYDLELQQVSKNLGLGAAWTSKISTSPPKGALGVGRTLYVPGTDDYFEKNFVYDPDDPFGNPTKYGKAFASEQGGFGGNALKTKQKVRAFGNRFSATKYLLEKEGDGNLIKGARKLMGANKGRVAAGVAFLGTGLAGGYLVNKGIQNIKSDGKVQAHTRKVGNKFVKVKSFIRGLRNEKKKT